MIRLKSKLRQEWRQPVDTIGLCIALLLMTLMVVGRGIYLLETGHAPRLGPAFWLLSLSYMGALILIDTILYEERRLSPVRWTASIGYALLAFSRLAQSGTQASNWLEIGGFVFIGVTLLISMFDFGSSQTSPIIKG